MNYSEFYKELLKDEDIFGAEGKDYVQYHARRFWDTYKKCANELKSGDKVLSVGSGFASIEKMLVLNNGVELTIVDFQDSIDLYKTIYDRYNIKYIAADLSKEELPIPTDHYDMLLQSEVIEHLPVAPSEQFEKFKIYLKRGGKFVVTTPNIGSILQIMLLLFMQPIMPTPEKFFSPVGFENQEVHRREYLPVEIKEAFTKAGFSTKHISFFFYTFPKSIKLRILYGVGQIIPRFRPGMLLIGVKN